MYIIILISFPLSYAIYTIICLIGAWFEPRSHVKYGDGIAISMHGLSGQKHKFNNINRRQYNSF